MFHACVQKFDVTENFENFWELNKAKAKKAPARSCMPNAESYLALLVYCWHVGMVPLLYELAAAAASKLAS